VPLGLNALDDDRRCAYLYIIDIYIHTLGPTRSFTRRVPPDRPRAPFVAFG
jgi:hypothetical protein